MLNSEWLVNIIFIEGANHSQFNTSWGKMTYRVKLFRQ